LFIAQFVSNIGTWMQIVAAPWFSVESHSSRPVRCRSICWSSPALKRGGHSWQLYQRVGEPDTFIERFTVASWTEFERQRTERWLAHDSQGTAKAIGYTVDQKRRPEYYLAVRVPR
jgi:hypothetical protein